MNNTVKHGLLSGILMSVLLFGLSISGNYGGSSLKLMKYLILLAVIAFSLYSVREKVKRKNYFRKALIRGLNISLISAVMISLVNLVLFLIDPSYAISKWNLTPSTLSDISVINMAILFDLFVYGGIATFIVYQGLKPSPDITR